MYRWCTDEQLAEIERAQHEQRALMREYFAMNGMDKPVNNMTVSVTYPEGTFVHHYQGTAPLPPEKEIAVPSLDRRVGDARRGEYTDHLSLMFQQGYISQSEFTDRIGKASAALTESDLSVLIRDLPPLSPKLPAVVKEEKYHVSVSPAFAISAAAMAMLTVLISLHFPGSGDLAAVLAFFWMIAFSGFAWITRKK